MVDSYWKHESFFPFPTADTAVPNTRRETPRVPSTAGSAAWIRSVSDPIPVSALSEEELCHG